MASAAIARVSKLRILEPGQRIFLQAEQLGILPGKSGIFRPCHSPRRLQTIGGLDWLIRLADH